MMTIFFTVLRYIYQNPIKAGLVKIVEQYKWSNYSEYINNISEAHVDFVLGMFNRNKEKAVKIFIEYIGKPCNDVCLEFKEKHIIKDEEARQIIKNLCNVNSATELQKFNILVRNKYLKELKESYRLTIRQIERLTGINRGLILKA